MIAIGLMFSSTVFADCASSGLTVYPDRTTITKNSLFFIEGYYFDQQVVRDFGDKSNAYLVSGKKRIKLETVRLFEGMMHLTMAMMKPESPLESGHRYDLEIIDEEAMVNEEMSHMGE